MAAKLRKGDTVVVLCGKREDKGRQGEIVKIMPAANKAIVTGINMVTKHTKQSQSSQGGRVRQEAPIHLSNLALVDANGKATRVGFRMDGDNKVRFAKTTGDAI